MTNLETYNFIREHAEDDVRQLALRGAKAPEVDLAFALDQISGRQKARVKLPSWAAIDGITYPPHLSIEQCSSEMTARYKADIVGNGQLMVDLTGGFGVDFAFMSTGFCRAVYVERQRQLCAISSRNFATLGLQQAEVVCADGIDYLHTLGHADLIFIDPARRDDHGVRTYGIADCTPNVLELMDELTRKADRILIKLSPMLDWRKAVADIGRASQVHIVSVDNECKELLLFVNSTPKFSIREQSSPTRSLSLVAKGMQERGVVDSDRLRVVCVNLLSDGTAQRFEFESPSSDLIPHSSFSIPHFSNLNDSFLVEPNASVMKAGCFQLLEQRFGISQLEANSHLFVCDRDVPDFPGRRFIIERTTSMNKRELKAALSGIDRANIAVRNFPLKAEQLRQKLKLRDGGDTYIFATTVRGGTHQLFICRKIG